ncbi:DDE family transposase [Falsibacillus pallidus]|uniref:DDE family transposase n=2 Tax=Falsibacillus pallidus TaxID=493781 RepID=A0A370G0U7_9BACI|nr:DDE family transposase [Falsibacillus pallidus]
MDFRNDIRPLAKSLNQLISVPTIRDLAKETGFVKRLRKFRPEDFFLLCTLLDKSVGSESLSTLCATLSTFSFTHLSKQGLDQRFTPNAVSFLKRLFFSLVAEQEGFTHPLELERLFSRILIKDSTSFQLPGDYSMYPGSHGSGVKIQLEYELYKGQLFQTAIDPGTSSDRKSASASENHLQPGDLCLRDIGYYSAENLIGIHQKGAYYLSRIPANTTLWKQDNEGGWIKIEPLEEIKKVPPGEVIEFPSLRVGKWTKRPLMARVIIQKLTRDQQKKRDALLQKKGQKGKPTQSAKQRNSIQILVTNIPQDLMEAQMMYSLYSLRWQIEILFKTWKSLFQIHEIKEMKQERMECHLYGTLIRIFLSTMLAFQCRYYLYRKERLECSEYKSINIAQEGMTPLAYSLSYRTKSIMDIVVSIYESIYRNGRKDHRFNHSSVFDILQLSYKQTLS